MTKCWNQIKLGSNPACTDESVLVQDEVKTYFRGGLTRVGSQFIFAWYDGKGFLMMGF